MKQQRQIIHLHLLNSDEHFYYGSISAMYQHHDANQLGVAKQSLYNHWNEDVKITNKAIIRRGKIISSVSLR